MSLFSFIKHGLRQVGISSGLNRRESDVFHAEQITGCRGIRKTCELQHGALGILRLCSLLT